MKIQNKRITNGVLLIVFVACLISCSEGKRHAYQKHVVEMKEMQFQPAELSIQKGDTVVFINRDLVAHNITEASKAAWSSSLLPTGKSFDIVVNQSYNYICTIHPTMKGKIIVE